MELRKPNLRLVLLLFMAWLLWRQLLLTPLSPEETSAADTASVSSPSYAYASIIGGVDPSYPSYRGFLFNVLLASRILRQNGSKADFVLFIQLSHSSSTQELPSRDIHWLNQCQIKLRYIPRSPYQGFYEIMLEKFRILQLVQYQRVLFMDADVMPLDNLDYLFEMSSAKILKENLVVAGKQQPCSGGFFMLAPGVGKWKELQSIIRERERKAQHLITANKFDIVRGWGHVILPPDQWETTVPGRTGTNWTFYGADSDQGLLYEWVKYSQQSVSLVIGPKIQNWGPGGGNYPKLNNVLERPFQNLTVTNRTSPRVGRWAKGAPPTRHFYHFTGNSKPWEQPKPEPTADHTLSPQLYWFLQMDLLNKQLNLFEDWESERVSFSKPPLGRFNSKADIANRVDRSNQQPAK